MSELENTDNVVGPCCDAGDDQQADDAGDKA